MSFTDEEALHAHEPFTKAEKKIGCDDVVPLKTAYAAK
jgi:hypothetical protein